MKYKKHVKRYVNNGNSDLVLATLKKTCGGIEPMTYS